MAVRLGWFGGVLGGGLRNPLLADAGSTDHLPPFWKQFFLPRRFSSVDVDGRLAYHWLGRLAGVQAAQGFPCFPALGRGLRPALRGRVRSWARSSPCLDRVAFQRKHPDQSRRPCHGVRPPEKFFALPQGEPIRLRQIVLRLRTLNPQRGVANARQLGQVNG